MMDKDQLCITTIRTLSMDAIQQANGPSGNADGSGVSSVAENK